MLSSTIEQHRGRVVHYAGDAVLAMFEAVVDALSCAAEVQRELQVRNEDVPDERRVQFRVGVNLGDVIEDRGDIYGDGVNVAARLESLADPGGICISRYVYDQVKNKPDLGYEFLGEQQVKNIAEPVEVYRVRLEPEAAGTIIGKKRAKSNRWQWLALGTVVVVVVSGVAVWLKPWAPDVEPASVERMAFPLPDKPSVAVLPFANMSGDPQQEYFADGITEDLTTSLAKFAGLFVIARNSAFTYKGKAVKVPQVAQELGVRYILEGSVQKAGDTVRVNAQLIDSTTGGHVWAERYDGAVDGIFSLQDKIRGQIMAALAVELTADERQQAVTRETESLEAYDWFLQGWNQFRHATPEALAEAVEFFTQAIELDPDYGRAHAALADTYFLAGERGFSRKLGITWAESRHRARHYLRLALKHPTSLAHQVASTMALKQRLYTEALRHAEQAVALDPSDAGAHSQMAYALLYAGTPDEVIEFARRAMRLDPSKPGLPLQWQGRAEFTKGNLEEAVTLLERGRQHKPTLSAVQVLAAAYAQLGRDEDARAALKIYHDKTGWSPTLKQLMYFWPYKDAVVAQRFADGLHKAGLSGPPGGYFVVSERDRMTGSEMLRLVGGRTTGGSDLWGSEPWSREYFTDGRVTRRDGAGESAGKFWVEDDLLCEQWDPSYLDCYPIFRNENGSPETKDEYLSMLDTGMFPWSFED